MEYDKMERLYAVCNDKEKLVIEGLYLYYGESRATFDTMIYSLSKLSHTAAVSFLKKLKNAEMVIDIYSVFLRDIRVEPMACVFSMIKAVEKSKETKSKKKLDVKDMAVTKQTPELLSVKRKLLDYLLAGKPSAFTAAELEEESALELLKLLYIFPQFDGMQKALPTSVLIRTLNAMWQDVFLRFDDPAPLENYCKQILQSPQLNDEMENIVKGQFMFLDLYRGRNIDEMATMPRSPYFMLNYIKAYCNHLMGNISEAIDIYEEVFRGINPKAIMPGITLFNYSYSLALMEDSSPGSKKKVADLLKKKDLKKPENGLSFLVLNANSGLGADKFEKIYEEIKGYFHNLVTVLFHSVDTYFGLSKINHDFPKDGVHAFDLLMLEVTSAFEGHEKEYAKLKQKLGYPSLISRLHRVEEWEKVFNAIKKTTASGTAVATNSQNLNLTRIIYLLNPVYMSLSLLLQKSQNGVTWSKGRAVSFERFARGGVEGMNETDRQVAAHVKKYNSSYYYGSISYELDDNKALAELVGYPLVFLSSNPSIPVEVVKGNPEMTLSRTKTGFSLSLNIDSNCGAINVVRETDTRVKVISLTPKQLQTVKLLSGIKTLPAHAESKITELLASLKDVITIYSDLIGNDSSLKTIKGDNRMTVQLIPVGNTLKVELFVKPLITEPPYCKAGQGAKSVVGMKDNEQVQVVRNFKKEKENYNLLSALLQEISGDDEVEDIITFDEPHDCLELLDGLRQFGDNCVVEWPEGARYRISRTADIDNLSLSLKGKGNWFQMEGELKLDDDSLITIKELMGKVRSMKGRFIQLNETEFLSITDRLRKQLAEISGIATEEKGKLQVQQFATIAFDKWAEQGVTVKGDKNYRALKERIEQAADKQHKLPKQLNAELRDYQQTGFNWLARLYDWRAGACLADDMGLGKTVQSISMLIYKATEGASMVVSPASVLLNWQTEINKFAPSLNVLVLNSATDRQKMIAEAEAYDVVLSTYGLLMTETKALTAKKWNIVILDEAHTIKNRDTKTSKAAMKIDADFRIALTGTPIQNHLGEIWNLFHFVNPGLLGSIEQFTERFVTPITQYQDKEVQKRLKKIISPFILRRTKNEVLEELPSRTEIIKEIELSDAELAFYEVLRRQTEAALASGESTPIQALSEITRLRQAACNTALVDKDIKLQSSKEEAFLDIVKELTGNSHRALVFSQFTSHLALIKAALDKLGVEYLYLDGSTPINERTRLVKSFQTGSQPLFLISLKAGGLGLNLTAADYVIHLDPWWNPAIEDQASDRAHRIGQQRPVTIYKLIAKHTIEEKIIRLHATKKDLADSLLEGSNVAHKLTREELLELLK